VDGSWVSLAAELPGFRSIVLDRPGWGLSSPIDYPGRDYGRFVGNLLVATLDAGVVAASGSQDTSLCDDGFNEGGQAGPFTSTAGPVELDEGVYLVVPRGFRWEISKTVARDDADVFYAGQVIAQLGSTFIRQFNTRGLIVEPDRNWGLFTVGPSGTSVSLEISAEAWACSHAEIGGSVAIVRIG